MPGTDYASAAINIFICRSVFPGRAGGHVPGMSAAYENQAEQIAECSHLQPATTSQDRSAPL